MTRWKREPRETILLMHAHNRMSVRGDCILSAAESLGLLVGFCRYPNHADGSTDREWYVSSSALARVGGLKAVEALAWKQHSERLGY